MRIEEIVMVLCAKSDAALKRAQSIALGTRNAHALEVFARESETVNLPGAVDTDGCYERNALVQGPARKGKVRARFHREVEPSERAIPYRDQSTAAKYDCMFVQPEGPSAHCGIPAAPRASATTLTPLVARDQAVTPSNAPVFFLRTGSGEVFGEIIGDPDWVGEGPPSPVRYPILFARPNDAASRCRKNWTVWMVETRWRKLDGADQTVLTSDKARNMKQGIKGLGSRVLSHRVAVGYVLRAVEIVRGEAVKYDAAKEVYYRETRETSHGPITMPRAARRNVVRFESAGDDVPKRGEGRGGSVKAPKAPPPAWLSDPSMLPKRPPVAR